jgi:hypothetical protein
MMDVVAHNVFLQATMALVSRLTKCAPHHLSAQSFPPFFLHDTRAQRFRINIARAVLKVRDVSSLVFTKVSITANV